MYRMVERLIADISDPRRHIYQGAKCRDKYVKRSDIEAMDLPIMLYMLYHMVIAQP